MRRISVWDNEAFVSKKISKVITVPVFSLASGVYVSSSAPYLSDEVMIIKSMSVVAGSNVPEDVTSAVINAMGPSKFSLVVGDNELHVSGDRRAVLTLPPGLKFAELNCQTNAQLASRPGELVVTRAQWLRIDCIQASLAHSDVTVKITAEIV